LGQRPRPRGSFLYRVCPPQAPAPLLMLPGGGGDGGAAV
jgi:hypothetical protein